MWAGKKASLFLCLLVCLFCGTSAQEGYVRLNSFDLDLDNRILILRFSKDVTASTFDPTTISLTDDSEFARSSYVLTSGTATAVDGNTLSVTLTQSDVNSLVAIPGLCLNTFTCYLAYTLDLVQASNSDPTLPGVLRVANFVPYPLFLDDFALDMNTGALRLNFNKNVSAHNVDPTAITLMSDLEGSETHCLLWAECDEDRGCTDSPSITIYLSQDDQNYLKQNTLLCTAIIDTFMSFESSVIIDLGGYNVKIVQPGTSNKLQASQYIEDTTSPHLVSFDMDVDNATFYLRFSEAVDAETFNITSAGQLVLKNPLADNFTVDFFGTDWYLNGSESISTVIVLVAEEVMEEVIFILYRGQAEHSLMDSSGGLVHDWNSNIEVPTTDSPVVNLDGLYLLTLLADYPFVFDRASHAFLITFPCEVPFVYDASNVELLNDHPYKATKIYPMSEEFYYGDGNIFAYFLPDELTRELAPLGDVAKVMDNTFLRLREPFCGETGQLVVRGNIEVTSEFIHLVTFTMDMDRSKVQLTFDNLLDYNSRVDPSQVMLQKDNDSAEFNVSLSASSRWKIYEWRLDIFLEPSDVEALRTQGIARDITTSHMSVQPGVVSDIYGRNVTVIPVTRAIQAERYIPGVPPERTMLTLFSFNCTSGLLSLTFSQRVNTKTFDLTQLWLENERQERVTIWKGTYVIEYTDSPEIQLDPEAMEFISGRLGFLVNPEHIYLGFTQNLVYDIYNNLLNASNPFLGSSPNGVACRCHNGYQLTVNQSYCIDINECDYNNAGCSDVCSNSFGSYNCSCPTGHRLEEDMHTCVDIDECLENISGCNQTCVNDPGSYYCECDTNEYVLLSDRHSCGKIEHCDRDDGHIRCEQGCVDDYSAYRCVCREGYRLSSNLHNCSDIDECTEGTSGCTQACTNLDSSYSCSCWSGYYLGDDMHTCFDINECDTSNGGCEHYCANFDGSHQCSCQEGYTKGGMYQCTPDPCNETLVAPEYGSVMCDGPEGPDVQATNQTCVFSCEPGFYVKGSSERVCQPNHTWSGDAPYCERLRCPRLSGFEDASVVLPCDNAYESSCQINCLPDYFKWDVDNNTVTCVVQSEAENTVGWTARPVCIKRQPCLPNPCLHGAECTEVETVKGGVPNCQCSGTGYRGDICEVGVVSIPTLPLLTVGETHTFIVSAKPDSDLTVEFDSRLGFTPNVFTFTPWMTEVTVSVTPSSVDVYIVNTRLTGTDAYIYDTPPEVTIVVQDTTPFKDVNKTLSPGCCSNESESIHSCLGTSSTITFYSTCRHQTHIWEDGARILEGTSFTTAGELSLPLSLRSVLLQSSGARGISFQMSPYESEDGTSQCTPCGEQECSSEWDCSCYDPTTSIAYYLQQESLAKTYLQNIAPLLPSWMKLEAVGSDRLYDDLSFRVELVDSEDLYRIPQCRGFFSTKNVDFGTYSVLVYSGTFMVSVGEDTISHTPSANDALCVAVNLCDGKESPVYISLPTDFRFEQFSALNRLSIVGWKLEKVSGLIVTSSTPLEYYWEKADLMMNAEVSFTGRQGGTSLDLSFDGLVRLNTTTPLTQLVIEGEAGEMSVFLDGSTEAVLNASGQLLHLRDLETHTEITPSGPPTGDTEVTDLSYSCHSISLTLSQWMVTDKDNIFNRVFSDGGLFNTPVTIDVTLDSSGRFSDVSCHTSGHKLLGGGFMLPGMRHSLHLLHRNSSLLQQSYIPVTPSNINLAIVSRPKAFSTLPAFWFLKLNGEVDEPIILTTLNMAENTIKGQTLGPDTAVASLFSQRFPVQLQISEVSCVFYVTASLFGVTDAKVSAEIMADESGQALLRMSGSLERGEISRGIEEQAIAQLRGVQGGMGERADLAQHALDEVTKMKDAIDPQVNEADGEMQNASQLYDESRRTRQRKEIEYHSHNVAVTLQARQYESTPLFNYLADLCTLKESCAKEMVSKVVCQECDLQVQTNRRVFGETTCGRKRTFPEEVSQLVQGPLVTGVEGPEVNTISCDSSIPSYWDFSDFGCTIIAVPERRRDVSSPTLHRVNHTTFVEREVEYTCNSAWDQERQWVMDHYCCEVQESSLLHNHTCLGRNVACRLARSQAYEVYSAVPDAVNLFSELDDRLQRLTVARLKESEAYESYQAASSAHGQLSYFKEQIEHLKRHREDQVTRLRGRIAPGSVNNMEEKPLSVDEIQFDLLVESRMSATIPLTILFSLPNSSNNVMTFDFHFSSIAASTAAAAQTLFQSVLNSTESSLRMNASFIPQRNDSFSISASGSTDFDSYCQDLQQVTSFIRYLSSSLERSADHYSSSVVGVEDLKADLSDRLYSVKEWHNSGMWMMRNDSCNSSDCSATNANNEVSYEAEVTHFEDLVMTIIVASEELVYSAEERAYTRWLLDMEEEVGQIMAPYGCQGLVDCVMTAVEVLERALEVAGGTAEGVELLGDIPAAKEDLTNLTLVRDVGVGEMRQLLKKIESILQSSLELDYWCELTPDLSVVVSHESPVRNGTSMEYHCSSTSKFPTLFQWLKDGSALPGETRPILALPNVTVESAGEYTCVSWTHKGEELETTTRLVVHQYPELTMQPMNNITVFPEEGAVFFRCNASGVPVPSWQWYFRSPNSSQRMPLENETSSELIILPPSPSREGWYYCEASNVDDCYNCSVRSDGVYLRVLESSVADIAVPAVVTLFDNVTQQDQANEESTIPRTSQTANYVRRSKELSELSQNLTSVIAGKSGFNVILPETKIVMVYNNGSVLTISFVISSIPLKPNDSNKPEETFAEIEAARMDWLEGIEGIIRILPNVDYSSLGISYDEFRSAEVNQSRLLVRCPAGQELRRDTNLFCVGCAPGTFQSFAVEQLDPSTTLAYPTPAPCPLGHYQPNPSQAQCLPCPAGTFTPLLGQTSCQLCPVAEYQDEEGQVVCKECPDGYTTEGEGSTNLSSCVCVGASCPPCVGASCCVGVACWWVYIVICVAALVVVCCCCIVVVCCWYCCTCRRRRGKYKGPHRIEDIWGEDDVEMPIIQSEESTSKQVRAANISEFLGLDAEGQRVRVDWQDMVESGVSEGGDGILFRNPMFDDMSSEDGVSGTWSFGKMVETIDKGNLAFLDWGDGYQPVPQYSTVNKKDNIGLGEEEVDDTSFVDSDGTDDKEKDEENNSDSNDEVDEASFVDIDGANDKIRDEEQKTNSDEEEKKSKGEESSSEDEESGESDTKEEGSEAGSRESDGEEVDEDTLSAEATSSSALLPKATGEEEVTPSTTAPVSLPTATKEEAPSGPKPMTQEEMEYAMAELQQAEDDLGGSLIGWDDINNLLLNQWQDVQQMDNEEEASLTRVQLLAPSMSSQCNSGLGVGEVGEAIADSDSVEVKEKDEEEKSDSDEEEKRSKGEKSSLEDEGSGESDTEREGSEAGSGEGGVEDSEESEHFGKEAGVNKKEGDIV